MNVALIPHPLAPFPVPTVPSWARPRGSVAEPAEAAFLAGAALNSLDNLVRANPPWAGAWRQRLALTGAAAAMSVIGRAEDEAGLRDAWHLRQPGDDPGPAGRVLAAWRRLAERSPNVDLETLRSVTGLLGIRWSDELATLPDQVEVLTRTGAPAPFAAAAILRAVDTAAPGAELLGWWLADQVLALRLRWPLPVPLLMAEAQGAAFRRAGRGGRLRPADNGFDAAICLAVVHAAARALRCAAEIAPRAARLQAVMPKLRAKGAGEAIALLLDDDAVPGTLTTPTLSRWAARRLFERLEALGAVRELTGRSSFKLYGL
ncbi:DUF1403 family protein [Ancylobacter sp. FA202]|uniref:DUF1403 family protein n=1 Tax=Ancylobacter sp. FA202 TaxID=1111106 RepID=UPI000378E4B3|nr:DUF1403 family protein [Ancylobacter sp. FA202]